MHELLRKWFSAVCIGTVPLTNVNDPVGHGMVSLPPDHVNVPVRVDGFRYATAAAWSAASLLSQRSHHCEPKLREKPYSLVRRSCGPVQLMWLTRKSEYTTA